MVPHNGHKSGFVLGIGQVGANSGGTQNFQIMIGSLLSCHLVSLAVFRKDPTSVPHASP